MSKKPQAKVKAKAAVKTAPKAEAQKTVTEAEEEVAIQPAEKSVEDSEAKTPKRSKEEILAEALAQDIQTRG